MDFEHLDALVPATFFAAIITSSKHVKALDSRATRHLEYGTIMDMREIMMVTNFISRLKLEATMLPITQSGAKVLPTLSLIRFTTMLTGKQFTMPWLAVFDFVVTRFIYLDLAIMHKTTNPLATATCTLSRR